MLLIILYYPGHLTVIYNMYTYIRVDMYAMYTLYKSMTSSVVYLYPLFVVY